MEGGKQSQYAPAELGPARRGRDKGGGSVLQQLQPEGRAQGFRLGLGEAAVGTEGGEVLEARARREQASERVGRVGRTQRVEPRQALRRAAAA